jgi:hypothetical protein
MYSAKNNKVAGTPAFVRPVTQAHPSSPVHRDLPLSYMGHELQQNKSNPDERKSYYAAKDTLVMDMITDPASGAVAAWSALFHGKNDPPGHQPVSCSFTGTGKLFLEVRTVADVPTSTVKVMLCFFKPTEKTYQYAPSGIDLVLCFDKNALGTGRQLQQMSECWNNLKGDLCPFVGDRFNPAFWSHVNLYAWDFRGGKLYTLNAYEGLLKEVACPDDYTPPYTKKN